MRNWSIKDNETITTDEDVILSNIKERIMNLVKLAANVDGLINFKIYTGNIDLLRSFVNYYLIHFSTSMNWRYTSYNTLVSDILTESDEAVCIYC